MILVDECVAAVSTKLVWREEIFWWEYYTTFAFLSLWQNCIFLSHDDLLSWTQCVNHSYDLFWQQKLDISSFILKGPIYQSILSLTLFLMRDSIVVLLTVKQWWFVHLLHQIFTFNKTLWCVGIFFLQQTFNRINLLLQDWRVADTGYH